MIQCVLNCTVTYVRKRERGGIDNKQLCDLVPKLVKTGHEVKCTILWNQQCEPTELLLIINRTA
jgi:hypothetical protein